MSSLNILNNISNKYYKACFAAYVGDFDNFYKNFIGTELVYFRGYKDDEVKLGELDLNNALTYYISRGCRFSFTFAYKLRNSGIALNKYILRNISARFIMSNYLDDDVVKNYVPACIWYPNIPLKETCLKLIKINDLYNYLVYFICVFNSWNDVYSSLNLVQLFRSSISLAKKFNNYGMLNFCNEDDIIDSSFNNSFIKFGNHLTYNRKVKDVDSDDIYINHFFSQKVFTKYNMSLIHDELLEYSWDEYDSDCYMLDKFDNTLGLGFLDYNQLDQNIIYNELYETSLNLEYYNLTIDR
ncbi:hypothetical protein Kpol_1039p14 [Vanderwaltozyma polyspora DSM 70294]|uniref:Uncharacterized protein n=1 Tax=Vanderwaltozyma polyspora (strain ATCC 22028 / DSM 70294 / BCRC 21397 / CBS 2163 / NBRC 10782 / NRRL Y-8283 / UCD 57-17) TaxID=436907 RepID=A7THE1_VANPO|nr:uncharacterized protein Kpol_1039p14 [Vanderwaltozyma polyspora DSM 70294]EDO18265.1 hypothetical protein Kpol_1039p14 [Vanderwaltozyma polyspora DSM 70294]